MQELANRFTYKDGVLIKKCNNRPQTTPSGNGYLYARWDRGAKGVTVELAHRLIWYMHYGAIPAGMLVDHIDMNPLNNVITNLRLVSHGGNNQNKRHKGYYYDKQLSKYRVRIQVQGTNKHIGLYANAKDARAAYVKAKRALHKHASEGALTF